MQPEIDMYLDFFLPLVSFDFNLNQAKYPIRHLDPLPEIGLYAPNLFPRQVDLPGHPVGVPLQAFGHHGGGLLLITF